MQSESRVYKHPVDIFFSLTLLESSITEVSDFVFIEFPFLKGWNRGFSPKIRVKILPYAPLLCLTKKQLVVGVES